MNWSVNEYLFYIGLAVAACALFAALIYFFVSRIKKAKLNNTLKEEYGDADLR